MDAPKKRNDPGRVTLKLSLFYITTLLVLLLAGELLLGEIFIARVSKEIETIRRREFKASWQKYLTQRKRVHEHKVSGYSWWNEAAIAVQQEDLPELHNNLFGGDQSLVKEYDVFLVIGKNKRLLYGAIDQIVSTNELQKFRKKREYQLENFFIKLTNDALIEYRPAYEKKIKNNKKLKVSLPAPIVWHYITNYNNEIRLLTLSPICQNEGYPFTEGFYLYGYKMDKVIKLAEQIIPAKINIHKHPPTDSYLYVEHKGVHSYEKFYISFEPRFLVEQYTRRTLYLLLAAQTALSVIIILLISPGYIRRITVKLRDIIDKQTFRLKKANQSLLLHQSAIKREMKLAQAVQKNLLPPANIRRSNIHIYSFYQPVHDLAGDVFECIVFSPREIGILVADVAGHGIPAALISMMVNLSFAEYASAERPPNETLELMNRRLLPFFSARDYLTAVYVKLDGIGMKMSYASAGHRAVFFYDSIRGRIKNLSSTGAIIGLNPSQHFKEQQLKINAGDRLLLYTDALIEEKNESNEFYGEKRVKRLMYEHPNLPGGVLKSMLLDDLRVFKQDCPYKDDLTLVLVDILAPVALELPFLEDHMPPEALENIRHLFNDGLYRECVGALKQIQRTDPQNDSVLYNLALALYNLQEYEESLFNLNLFLGRKPGHPNGLRLARAFEKENFLRERTDNISHAE